MARPSTVRRFRLELSHVDAGVYESLDLRVAQHPSESLPFLVARVLGYCVCWRPELELGRGGVSSTEEPALWAKDPTGRVLSWIEVGVPSADRIHKASKAADRVAVFAHKAPTALLEEARKRRIHRAADVELFVLDSGLLASLSESIDRTNEWTVVVSDGELYVTVGEATHSAALERVPLTG